MNRHVHKKVMGFVFGLLFTAVGSSAELLKDFDPRLSYSDGFCSGGSPSAAPVPTHGSYCKEGDAGVGRVVTRPFRLYGPFELFMSGNPNGQALSLQLENLPDHQIRDIRPDTTPGTAWVRFGFDIPDSWRGKDLRIVATDRSTGPMGWLAFSGPLPPDEKASLRDAKKIALKTPLITLLIFLPGLALSAFAADRGCRGTLKLGLITLAGIAIPGYVTFFGYVFSARVGASLSAVFPFVFAVTFAIFVLRSTKQSKELLLQLLAPIVITMFGSMAVLSMGYLYGGLSTPDITAQNRFSHSLPPDNTIPDQFAEFLKQGHVPTPMGSDWLSSDRPPLQTGMILALDRWIRGIPLWYQVASTIIQNLWIFAVWLLLRALRVPRLSVALVIGTTFLSGFEFVNSFYVWPKLLAAAYMIAFAIPIVAAPSFAKRGGWIARCLMAFLLACSFLAHGGTAFAFIGLACLLAFYRRREFVFVLRETCLVGLLSLVFYAPWLWYQKFIDPPGDRLLKYHLAGVEEVTQESALNTIYRAYRAQPFRQWLASKNTNVVTVFGHEAEYLKEIFSLTNPQSKRQVRALEFFHLLPAVGFVAFGVFGLLMRWNKPSFGRLARAGERMLVWAFASAAVWILLMFKPASTVVHQGAYAMVRMAMAGSILIWRAVTPRLGLVVCVCQSALLWVIYGPNLAHVNTPLSLMEVQTSRC